MFTGIVETTGTIVNADRVGGDLRLVVNAPKFSDKAIELGDSIACNGVCLTVVAIDGVNFAFDVSIESLDLTLIGDWKPGVTINLELALLPTTRLGGHIVSGHVDGLATLLSMDKDARSWRMVFSIGDEQLSRYVSKKGSITINGISLTVNDVDENQFEINVIPHTFEITSLNGIAIGDKVHIEVDIIARYLERLLSGESGKLSPSSGVTMNSLVDSGFIK